MKNKKIPGFENYSASPDGFIFSQRGIALKSFSDCHGYQRVDLYRDGTRYRFYVHVFIMAAFRGWRPGLEVNHKDFNIKNNAIKNLEYMTRQDNMKYKTKRKLYEK